MVYPNYVQKTNSSVMTDVRAVTTLGKECILTWRKYRDPSKVLVILYNWSQWWFHEVLHFAILINLTFIH